MIDYEVNIFDSVYRSVGSLYAAGKFVSRYVPSPTGYPAGSFVELTNTTVRERQSSTPTENFVRVVYQLDVYATSKAQCRSVYASTDEKIISLGFTRISGEFLDNADNVNVFRYTARYEADIDRDGTIYRSS